MWCTSDRKRRSSRFVKLIREAKKNYAPLIATKTVRRRFKQFLRHEVPSDTRRLRKRRVARHTSFDEEDTVALLRIVDTHPDLYLDEIQEKMEILRWKVCAPSTLWRELQCQGG